MTRRKTRLKDLAGELGLSVTTVSRALSGYSDVAAATSERVLAAAERLGYVPGSVGRMLVSGRTDFLATVLPVRDGEMIDPFVGAFLTGLSEGLAADGRDLLIGTVPQGRTELDVVKHIVDGARADALVLFRVETNDARVRFLIDRGFPFICHGRALDERRSYAWFDTDGEAAHAEAARLLLDLGHRDFALLTVAEPYTFAAVRRSGAEGALARAGLPLPADAVLAVPMFDKAAALAASRRLLSRSPRPTAILCATDTLALAVLEAARLSSVAVPDGLSVIGFDDIPVSAYGDPPLSTFDQRARESARRVAAMAGEVLENGLEAAPTCLVRPPFVGRGSHGRAPPSRRRAAAV